MTAAIKYSNDAIVSYSLNTYMPIEGYAPAFNGDNGRLEVRDYERQPFDVAEETERYLIRNIGTRARSTCQSPEAVTAAATMCCATRSSRARPCPTT